MQHSTQHTAKRTHDLGESKEGEKDKLDSKKSQTTNVEKSKNLIARISDVNDMLCEKPPTDGMVQKMPNRSVEARTVA